MSTTDQGRPQPLDALGHNLLEGRREGPYVYDEDGNRYLDGIGGAGTFNLGRRPPELADALRDAMRETDQGNFPMISIEKTALASALADFVPGPLDCTVFAVMRGEAMEAACKIARGFTGRPELVTVDGGCYGQTGFALTLSERADRDLYGPLVPEVRTIPHGDVEALTSVGAKTAAVILEAVQAENHCRTASPAYLRAVARCCRETGALLVLDETQTNFGRTGRRFAFEEAGVEPDILVLGEALGGGMFPIAATMLTQRVNAFLNKHPMIHLSTFGGSDVGCRVARKALELYERESPWENAAKMGALLQEGLQTLADDEASPIRSIAGSGLLWSLDLGAQDATHTFCRAAAGQGLLLLPGETARNTALLRPSLTICEEQVEEILEALRAAARTNPPCG